MRRPGNNSFEMPEFIQSHSMRVPVSLRPLTGADYDEWNEVRWRNDAWLKPWESGDPLHGAPITYKEWMKQLRRNERAGTGAVFAIEQHGRIVGRSRWARSATARCVPASSAIGWTSVCAGRGYAPMAVALLADWAMFDPTGPRLHRMEIDILPENKRSRAVARKVGATLEGVRRAYMYVNGQWRDHESYVLMAEDAPNGFTARLMTGNSPS